MAGNGRKRGFQIQADSGRISEPRNTVVSSWFSAGGIHPETNAASSRVGVTAGL